MKTSCVCRYVLVHVYTHCVTCSEHVLSVSLFCSKKDPDILEKVIGNLCLMLGSDVVPVVKKVILTMATLYKVSLQVRHWSL